MGCWNGSCALSGLPIFHGDNAYVYLLVRNKQEEPDNHCDPSSYFFPLAYHFEAQYNDYGGFEEETGPMIPYLLELIKERLVEQEQGENQYHDIPVKKDGFDMEKLIDADHEGRLFIRDSYLGEVSINHVLIRKDVLDQLFETYALEVYVGGEDDDRYKYVKYADVLEQNQAVAKAIFEKCQANPDNIIMRFAFDGIPYSSVEARFLVQTINSTRYQWLIHPSIDLAVAIETKNYELFSILIEQITHHYWLNLLMHEMRRSWVVPSGAGSQNDSTNAHKVLANVVLNVASQIDNRFAEYE